jgi:hypothetical protein
MRELGLQIWRQVHFHFVRLQDACGVSIRVVDRPPGALSRYTPPAENRSIAPFLFRPLLVEGPH